MVDKRKTISLDKIIPSRTLMFLYKNKFGRIILRIMISRTLSKIVGAFLQSSLSKPLIKGFVKNNNIDLTQFETNEFKCYNDCFIRKIKQINRPMSENNDGFLSPCDSKLSAYNISEKSRFKIKNSYYSVKDLIADTTVAEKFVGGYALVFRLCVDDYHRYAYIDDGTIQNNYFIKGKLHTVQPIALEKDDFFKENCREITIIKTENFGRIAQIEVGAMMVGKIVNYKKSGFVKRGEEKGYFKFGGSTVVLLVEKDKIIIDDEIIENTMNNKETIVKYLETIGMKK